MARVVKKSGDYQEFSPEKLERSIRRAGASLIQARHVVEGIPRVDEMSTQEIRNRVARALEIENPAIADAYMTTRSLRARTVADIASGVVRINRELADLDGIHNGQVARLWKGNRAVDILIETVPSASLREIELNESDLEVLDAHEGSIIKLKFDRA